MLEVAVNVESAKSFEAGKVTAIGTYNTRYTHSSGEPVRITFGLGSTVSVNVIIVLPTLTACKMILDIDENKVYSKSM